MRDDLKEIYQKFRHLGFVPISRFGKKAYAPYETDPVFADLCYTLLYAWEPDFGNLIRIINGNAFLVSNDIHGKVECSVIIRSSIPELTDAVKTAQAQFREAGCPFSLTYVDEKSLALLRQCGFSFRESFDRDYSDYIFDTAQFLETDGGKNRRKRYELLSVEKKYPGIHYETGSIQDSSTIFDIFRGWCSDHACEDCVFGCERTATERILAAADPHSFHVGFVLLDQEPIAFILCEYAPNGMVFYHTKKFKRHFKGLNYYIQYHTALQHRGLPYMNWAEDMGIDGLRSNKLKYMPCRLENKYNLTFE